MSDVHNSFEESEHGAFSESVHKARGGVVVPTLTISGKVIATGTVHADAWQDCDGNNPYDVLPTPPHEVTPQLRVRVFSTTGLTQAQKDAMKLVGKTSGETFTMGAITCDCRNFFSIAKHCGPDGVGRYYAYGDFSTFTDYFVKWPTTGSHSWVLNEDVDAIYPE